MENIMSSDFEDVGLFHSKFGLPHTQEPRQMTPTLKEVSQPQEIDDSAALFRLKFLLEELTEIAEGYGYKLNMNSGPAFVPIRQSHAVRQDLPKIADGLVDLCYVALGTAHLHRLPWNELWSEVQRANMSKERANGADDIRSTRGHSLDVVKPVGFKPPAIVEVLMANGWPGPPLPLEK
jgi:predicted HAD superfamily Cof-like phosphohydrolase